MGTVVIALEDELIQVASPFANTKSEFKTLALDQIRRSIRIQPRMALDEEAIEKYRSLMAEGTDFPEIVAVWDKKHYWLADGYHRFEAARRCGRKEIEAKVFEGTQEKAILFACGANARHGLPLNHEDKRQVTGRMLRIRYHARLENPEGKHWSDRAIARYLGVSQPFVSKLQKELFPKARQLKRHDPGNEAAREGENEEASNPETEPTDTEDNDDHLITGSETPGSDNGYHAWPSQAAMTVMQPQVATAYNEPEAMHAESPQGISSIAQALAAHVMAYFREHRDIGASVFMSALVEAVIMTEEQIRIFQEHDA